MHSGRRGTTSGRSRGRRRRLGAGPGALLGGCGPRVPAFRSPERGPAALSAGGDCLCSGLPVRLSRGPRRHSRHVSGALAACQRRRESSNDTPDRDTRARELLVAGDIRAGLHMGVLPPRRANVARYRLLHGSHSRPPEGWNARFPVPWAQAGPPAPPSGIDGPKAGFQGV